MRDQATAWLPEQASTVAPGIDSLFYFVTWVSVVLFVGVMAAMVYFVFKYRRREVDERPDPVKENKLIEISWIVVPTILVLIVFTWGFQSFIRLSTAPPGAYEINVRGQKWSWQFEYPNGIVRPGELHVPVGRPVRLNMSSQDVLHSLFIPAFRVKLDVLPNRYTSVWFEATRADTFQVFCTEYCGTEHSSMFARVIAHPLEEFNEWLATGGGDADMPLPELGEQLYSQLGCQACHSLDGSPGVGPTFQGLYQSQRSFEDGGTAEADENYLRESILEPAAHIVEGYQPVMPPFSYLDERQVSALVEFIKLQE